MARGVILGANQYYLGGGNTAVPDVMGAWAKGTQEAQRSANYLHKSQLADEENRRAEAMLGIKQEDLKLRQANAARQAAAHRQALATQQQLAGLFASPAPTPGAGGPALPGVTPPGGGPAIPQTFLREHGSTDPVVSPEGMDVSAPPVQGGAPSAPAATPTDPAVGRFAVAPAGLEPMQAKSHLFGLLPDPWGRVEPVPGAEPKPKAAPAAEKPSPKKEFVPTPQTSSTQLGKSFSETVQKTRATEVAPVSMADLMEPDRRRQQLEQLTSAMDTMRRQGALLARAGKAGPAMEMLMKMRLMEQERARYANLVNIAEFNVTKDPALIDQIVSAGSNGRLRVGATNDPEQFTIYRMDGERPVEQGRMTRKQLVEEYKTFYDTKYAAQKQAVADESRKRALDLVEYRTKEQIKATISLWEKRHGDPKTQIKEMPSGSGHFVAFQRGRPAYSVRAIEKIENGNTSYTLDFTSVPDPQLRAQ
jgi:hypothetical protein